MKFAVTFLVILLPGLAQAGFLAAGQVHSCAWDGRSEGLPRCWGNNEHGQLEVPKDVKNLLSLGAGAWHSCALHGVDQNQKVSCWGSNDQNQKQVPNEVQKPLQLSVGRWHSCVLHEKTPGRSAVACWGGNQAGQRNTPDSKIISPTAVFAGPDFSCARHQKGNVLCWGAITGEFPQTRFPRLVSESGFECAKKNGSIDCWSQTPGGAAAFIHHVGAISQCGLENGKVFFLDAEGKALSNRSDVKRVKDIVCGDWHVCAQDETGVKCWGDNDEKQATPPAGAFHFGPVLTELNQLPEFLNGLSEHLYQFDAEFLVRLAKAVAEDDSDAGRIFFLSALRPYLADMGYRTVKEDYVDQALRNLDRLVSGSVLKPSESNIHRALLVIHWAIQTAKSNFKAEDQAEASKLVNELGTALAGQFTLPAPAWNRLGEFLGKNRMSPYLANRILMCETLMPLVRRNP